jgi:DNA-binding CsgD family transcriptional regulator/tetratricopeptide (TPR) repeat protein
VELVDRSLERDLLTGLLAQAADGTSAAVVVRGEPGIGKTALLDVVAARAVTEGMRVARVTGVEAEVPLGYAALHRLLLPFPRLVEQLPEPQREALRSTFGLVAGPPPDRFLVALGVLTLLADAASEARMLCVIDDAQWLDGESAVVLGFVARRLQAEGIVMVFAARELSQVAPALQGLPEVVIGALGADDAATLLSMIATSSLNPNVASRLIAEGGGNPLALVELAAELTTAQLAGTAALPDPLPAAGSLQEMFSRRLGRLSPSAQLLLAVAAAEPTATDTILWRAAERLGVDAELAASEVTGLAEFGADVTFRHPLVRSVAYHGVPAVRRRLIHRTLAEVTDVGGQPDRVAWHLAMAATEPDEALAARLAQVAGRAMERGGYAARTTFLARAAELSADPRLRTGRVLAAAEAALTAGRPVQARALLDQAESGATGDEQVVTALRLAGQVSFATGRPGDAARQLLAAAKRLLPVDTRLGRRTLLAALTAATYAGKDVLGEVRAYAMGVAGTPVDLQDPSSTADCLLLGFLHRLSGVPEQAAPLLRAALGHLRDPKTPDSIRMSLPVVAGAPAAGGELLDESATYDVISMYVRFTRRAGALMALPAALTMLARVLTLRGRFDDAQEACAEGRALGEATGAPGSPNLASFAELALWCWRGREQEARDLTARITAEAEDLEDDARQSHNLPSYYLVVLELGFGRYRQACDHVLPIFRDDRLAAGTLVLPDLIEAAARCDELLVAQQALNRLKERAEASGAPWGLGWLARSQALLAGDAAEPLYRQAIDHLEQTAVLPEIARTHLLYGEWLRRQRRRRDARAQLRTAYDMLTQMGAGGFAARASAELAATGERPRRRSPETVQTLTPQEAQVARLVAEGGTNRDVAAELFISPATVEYHLRKVYQKLQVTSRTQLAKKMLSTS